MKVVFLGQVCAQGWAWLHSEVRFFVAKTSGCLGMGDWGGDFCCIHLKDTSFSPKGEFLRNLFLGLRGK